MRDALPLGVNFWDTSDDYGTRPHISVGLGLVDRWNVYVCGKVQGLFVGLRRSSFTSLWGGFDDRV